MADLDADGILDLVSGSWPGEVYWFRGKGSGEYEPGAQIVGHDGWPLNPGAGVEDRAGQGITITGDASYEQIEGSTESEVSFRGKSYRSTPAKPVYTTGCATHVCPVDWEGDGDIDLIIGDIRGQIHLARAKAPLEFEAVELLPINVVGDAGPAAADWDGDGDFDLLIGSDDGSVVWFENLS
ncbi:MAG: VCBS repeat-containing protein, partial [Verrucomicrobiota bacterium]